MNMTCSGELITAGRQAKVKILVDTGNSLDSCAAISKQKADELGLRIEPSSCTIGTASKGNSMTTCGTIDNLKLRFGGQAAPVALEKVVVLPELNGDINLGSRFLNSYNSTLSWKQGQATLQLSDKQGKGSEPILFQMEPAQVEPESRGSLLVLAAEVDGLVKVTINKDMRIDPHIAQKVIMRVANLPETASIFIPAGQTQNGLEVVDGIFRTTRRDKNDTVFQMLFLNNTEGALTLRAGLTSLEVYTCTDKGIRLDADEMTPPVTATINQLTGKTVNLTRKEQEILDELKIQENPYLNKNPDIKSKAIALVLKYADVFTPSSESQVGVTDLLDMKLKMKPGPVIRQKVRPMNPDMKASADKQVSSWLKDGIISPSVSEYSSPMVPVKKKDGTIRWCIDFRQVNDRVIADSFPIPRIEELVQAAAGHKLYSALDCFAAYHHIRVHQDSKKYTAFSTPDGHYEFNRMPFGIKPAVSIFSRFVAMGMAGVSPAHVQKYLDDQLAHTNGPVKMLEVLEQIFLRHRELDLKIKPSKTHLFQTEIQYLGHKLSEEGITMIPEYLEKILEWPTPKGKSQLSHMLGLFGYYRAFIPGFAQLTRDMNGIKGEKAIFRWTDKMTEDLTELKNRFKQSTVRTYPDYKSHKPFVLTIDFSSEAVGVLLEQEQGGSMKLIAAAGRKTTPGETHYASWKGEYAALVYGIRKFEHMLAYRPFIVKTDSKTLTFRSNIKPITGILARWVEYLSGFEFTTQHIPGKENVVADAISRTPEHLDKPSQEEEEEAEAYAVHQLQMAGIKDRPGSQVLNLTKFSGNQLEIAQKQDRILSQVYQWIKDPTTGEDRRRAKGLHKDLQFYKDALPSISLVTTADQNRVLGQVYQNWLGEPRVRLLVPDSLRDEVFQACHEHEISGHWGLSTIVARARNYFMYPGMATDLAARYMVCQKCMRKTKKVSTFQHGHYPDRAAQPMERLYIDLYGPLPEIERAPGKEIGSKQTGSQPGKTTFKYILSVEDSWSRYVDLIPIPDKTAITVATYLTEEFTSRFGFPAELYSDQGREFCNQVFEELQRLGKYEHIFSPAYNPQANKVERFHRNLTSMLTLELDREDVNWMTKLPAIKLAYNSKVHRAIGVTPALAFLGRELKIPISLIIPEPAPYTLQTWVGQLKDRYTKIFDKMYKNSQAMHRGNAGLYSNRKAAFQVGDLVWWWTKRQVQNKPLKITHRWTGLYRIVEVMNEICVQIQAENIPGKPITTTVHQLMKYTGDNIQHHDAPRQDEVLHLPPDDEVEFQPGEVEASAPMGMGAVAQNSRYNLRSQGFRRPPELPPQEAIEAEGIEEEMGPSTNLGEQAREPGGGEDDWVPENGDEDSGELEKTMISQEELTRENEGNDSIVSKAMSPIKHVPGAPKTPGVRHSTPWKETETPNRFQMPRKQRIIFRNELDPVEEENTVGHDHHNDTPRPDGLDPQDDPDATLTNEETVTDRGLEAVTYSGLRRSPRLRDEILGADETINDAALAGVMGANYADEEAEDLRRREQEEAGDLRGREQERASEDIRTPANTAGPDESRRTRSGHKIWSFGEKK